MSRFIDRTKVALQVERSRENVWVPNGLALPQRSYEPDGLVFDCRDNGGMAFPPETLFRDDESWSSRTFASTRTNWVINVNSSGEAQKAMDLGPVLAQTRVAIPVKPGMKVNFAGVFQLRKTGLHNHAADGQLRGQDVRVTIWGTGTTTDEYGVETTTKIELLTSQQVFQNYVPFVAPNGYVQVTLPTVSDATVPAGVDRIYMSVMLIAQGLNAPHTGQYQSFYFGALDTNFFAISKASPLRLFVRRPDSINNTVPSVLSSTGAVYPSRSRFDNLPPDSEVVLVSTSVSAVNVDVYQWDTARGPLLTTIALAPGQRVSTPVSTATGKIELVSAGSFGVERVSAQVVRTDTYEQTRTYRYLFADIIDDVASIAAEHIESDLALLTVKFNSNTVSPALRAGKRVRLLALHSAGYTQVYCGVIRGRRIVHRYGRPDQVEIVVHSAHGAVGQVECPVAYDRLSEYGPLVHTAGVPIVVDGVDYTGPARNLPDGWDYFPSYAADSAQTMQDALMLTRNTNKAFMFVDRYDQTIVTSTLPAATVAELSDAPGEGDISYNSRELESGADTANIVNAVAVEEHLLDRSDFVDRQLDREAAPIMLGDIASRTRRIEYRRETSVELFGLQRRNFGVIRGSGEWNDIIADKFGTTFDQWAADVLDEYAGEGPTIDRLRLTVITDADLQLISRLQSLDALGVTYRGQRVVRRIRRLEHRIMPHRSSFKWTVDVRFDATGEQNLWLPAPEDWEALEPALVEGEAGLVDGGNPEHPGAGVVDGGDQDAPAIVKLTRSDDFARPNGPAGANWRYYNPTPTPVIIGQELVMTTSTGGLDNGYQGKFAITYVDPVNGDNQEVSGRVTSAPTTSFQGLILGANDTLTSGVLVEFNRTQVIISAVLSPTMTAVRSQRDIDTSFTSLNRARFRREGDRYRFYRDDTFLFEWTDPGGFAVIGGKHGGLLISREDTTASAGFDDFQFKDI
ncbi:hypothetical protein [Rhodococcus sp. EPR-157]|uniref:hypothetical protein n=1 Tax=Rhodococcus sp. EPR-157 TaxID=1813677 RepID=UPI000AEF4F90|nr:hypothetical protein [Rhodococcus sp. EPR-157]